MKNTPVTTSTGIKMSSRWNESPKPMPIDDPDMITIQGWFICKPEWHKARRMDKIIYAISGIVGLIVICFLMVGGK